MEKARRLRKAGFMNGTAHVHNIDEECLNISRSEVADILASMAIQSGSLIK